MVLPEHNHQRRSAGSQSAAEPPPPSPPPPNTPPPASGTPLPSRTQAAWAGGIQGCLEGGAGEWAAVGHGEGAAGHQSQARAHGAYPPFPRVPGTP